MGKIICDVCGTSYSESAVQCPICGCVRPADSVAVAEDNRESGGYTYVKGGRFSKSNVRKRSQMGSARQSGEKPQLNKKIIGLAIVLFCLVVIVVLMVVFIVSALSGGNANGSNGAGVTSQSKPEVISCTELKLSQVDFTMDKIGSVVILDAIALPADTTDEIKYESTNLLVVTVDENTGRVICVGPGKAEILVTCGEITASCRVTCEVEPLETDPSQTAVKVTLMRKRIDDANYEGKFFNLYNDEGSDVPAQELTWISDDPRVATVNQSGRVTAVGEGSTTIRVEYNGVTVASCEIICDFTVPDNGEDPEGGDAGTGSLVVFTDEPFGVIYYSINEAIGMYDITLVESSSQTNFIDLYLGDKSNPELKIKVKWQLDEAYGGTCTISEDGTRISVDSSEDCRIFTVYNNTYYYVLIR